MAGRAVREEAPGAGEHQCPEGGRRERREPEGDPPGADVVLGGEGAVVAVVGRPDLGAVGEPGPVGDPVEGHGGDGLSGRLVRVHVTVDLHAVDPELAGVVVQLERAVLDQGPREEQPGAVLGGEHLDERGDEHGDQHGDHPRRAPGQGLVGVRGERHRASFVAMSVFGAVGRGVLDRTVRVRCQVASATSPAVMASPSGSVSQIPKMVGDMP